MTRSIPVLLALTLVATATSQLQAATPKTEAKQALLEGQRLGLVHNWTGTRSHFQKAEQLFQDAGGSANALFARVGRLRGEWETLSFPEVSLFLGELLQDPIV